MKSMFKFSSIFNNNHAAMIDNKYNIAPGNKVKNIKMVSKNIKIPLDGSSNSKAIDTMSDSILKYLIDNEYCAVHTTFSPDSNSACEVKRVDMFVRLDSYNHIVVYGEVYDKNDGCMKYMVRIANTIDDVVDLFSNSYNMDNASLMEYRNRDNLVLDFKCNEYKVEKITTDKLSIVNK